MEAYLTALGFLEFMGLLLFSASCQSNTHHELAQKEKTSSDTLELISQHEGQMVVAHSIKNTTDWNEVKTWKDLEELSVYKDLDTFDIENFSINKLIKIDSTKFGKHIKNRYQFHSVYFVTLKRRIGKCHPMIILAQQYDSDLLSSFLNVFMLDSALTAKNDFDFISGQGCDFEGCISTVSVFTSDSNYVLLSHVTNECEDPMGAPLTGEAKSFKVIQARSMHSDGRISTSRTDTTYLEFCK